MSEGKIKRKVLKIGLLGDTQVGKTAICNCFLNKKFNDSSLSTIGQDKIDSSIKLNNGEEIKLVIYDTAGQERFHAIALKALKAVQGVIVVFDLTSEKTFKNVANWLKTIKDNYSNVSVILFGNKCDLEDQRQVTKEDAEKYAKDNDLTLFLTSAKTDVGVKEGFKFIANVAYEKSEGVDDSQKVDLSKPKKPSGKQGGCCKK